MKKNDDDQDEWVQTEGRQGRIREDAGEVKTSPFGMHVVWNHTLFKMKGVGVYWDLIHVSSYVSDF